LLDGVPIIPKAEGLNLMNLALSSVIGYYERAFPILGPPVPQRAERLTSQSVATLGWTKDATATDAVTKVWYGVETRSWESFFDKSRSVRMPATEGVLRGFALQRLDIDRVEALAMLARDRLQKVKIDHVPSLSLDALGGALRARHPVVIVLDRPKSVAYTAVASHESWAVVVDPDSAKPSAVPAEQELLGEEDRKSPGEFATQARELLKNRKILLDEPTACVAKRPTGLRFLNVTKPAGRGEMHVVTWEPDVDAIRGAALKR
jgi:hypothetical protein